MVKSESKLIVSTLAPTETLLFLTLIIAPLLPPASEAQAQPVASVYFRISPSAHPLRRLNPPEPTSKPEFEEVDPVVPEVVKLTPTAPVEIERPGPVMSVTASPPTVSAPPTL